MNSSRRQFLNQSGLITAGLCFSPILHKSLMAAIQAPKKFTFEISLAEFSFAPELYTGKMTHMDFPEKAKNDFGISVLEYVSGFFQNKHTDQTYLKELKQRCDDLGMINHLIMVDGENIASLDANKRQKAVESHYPWVDAAKLLACSSIRVNLGDGMAVLSGKGEEGTPEEAAQAAIEGLGKLAEYAQKVGMNVIVENHFGYSTNPDWLVGIMKQVNLKNVGLLPDFGNFCSKRSQPETPDIKGFMNTKCLEEFDRYEGVKKMMPYAKGVSAKTHRFDEQGQDTETDFGKIFQIIKESGWTGGYVGIEYEGGLLRTMGGDMTCLSSDEGVLVTKKLLEKVRDQLGTKAKK
ncbi:MAG: sugar phosphate isomerase/epimerase family protein [Microscillaceae bacterium]|nr:sugar phosphate isomerase/epimerase family protein [Microscillaceae bacterium]